MADAAVYVAVQVGQGIKRGVMVRIIVLVLLLASCAVTSEDAPKMGQEVDPPYGWKYTYCPTHKDEIGCENF